MGFTEAVTLYFKNYVNFQGRSRRAEYWWPALMNLVIGWTLSGLAIITGGGFAAYASYNLNVIGWLFYGISILWGLATFLPNLSVTIRRLHDRNMSGWFVLLFIVLIIIPIINLIAIIVFIVFMAQEGTKGPNKFGPDPKGGHNVGVFD